MRILGIEIAGDYNSTAIKEATVGAEQFGRTVTAAATKNIERLSAQRVKLQELAGEYRLLAASAEKGSVQQIAAADLAAKAQKRLGLEVLATNSAVRTSARETALADREMSKFARGSLSATGGFGKAGIGLALGSGGFLAGAAVSQGIKSSIDAAKELAGAEEQLSVAIKNTGAAFDKKQLEDYLAAESKLSLFTKTELTSSLVGLVRVTGSMAKAQADATLAANVARGTGLDLSAVTQKIVALEAGRTRGVQQLGIHLPIVKTAQDALTASGKTYTAQQHATATAMDMNAAAQQVLIALQEKYHNSAKVFGASDASAAVKFSTAINTLEASIGTVLLPTVQAIATPFAAWAQKEADSGDAARKVKVIVGDLTGILKTGKTAVEDIDKVTGGFKHTLELLIALKFAGSIAGWTGNIIKFGRAVGSGEMLAAIGPVGWVALGIAAIGVAADKASPFVNALMDSLLKVLHLPNGGSVDSYAAYQKLPGYLKKQIPASIVAQLPGAPGAGGSGAGSASADSPGRAGSTGARGVASGQAFILDKLAAQGWKPDQLAQVQRLMNYEDPSGKPGDHNTSFGPRQLHAGGQLPAWVMAKGAAFAQQWAWSPEGLSAAAGGIAGFGNLHGAALAAALGNKQGSSDIPKETAAILGGGGGGSDASTAAQIAALVAAGKDKATKAKVPAIISGSALLGSLADKIAADTNSAKDAQGSAAAVWLKREKADLVKARTELGKKLATAKTDGASAKQIAAIKAEATKIDSNIASVNKSITTNLASQAAAIKAQIAATKASFAAAITADKQAIVSAFSNIITDAQTAFGAATQSYITGALGTKFFQGGLLTPQELRLADMQAQDTAQSLVDGLAAAQKQLADDMNGTLLEHIVDVATGKSTNIFGPGGSPAQINADNKAILAAQRAIDENNLATNATRSFTSVLDAANQKLAADVNATQDVIDADKQSVAAAQWALSASNLATNATGSLTGALADAQAKLAADANATQDVIEADKQAVAAAELAIAASGQGVDATTQRTNADKAYADATALYTQQRADQEHAMTGALSDLGKGIADGTAYIGQLPGILALYGLTTGDIMLNSGGQFADDMWNLGTATQALAQVMLDEAAALAALGDRKDAAAVQATAESIAWQTTVTPGQSSVTAGLGGASGYFMLNPVSSGTRMQFMADGGDILRDGLIYAHAGERVQPARVVHGTASGGGSTIMVTIHAPNYVGAQADLARAIKTPALIEAVATAVLMGNRRGHIRKDQLA